MLRKLSLAISAALVVLGLEAAAQEKPVVNFGIISTETTQNLRQQWDPLLRAMSEQTGLEIKPFFASDYAGIIEAQRFKKVDVAWYGHKAAMEAVDRAGGEVFVQTVNVDGREGYYANVVVHKDSPFNTLEDVLKCDKSLNFGLGDPNSTSGFLVPMAYIFAPRRIDPKECFKTVRSANHEANLLAVANKQADVAVNNNDSLARLKTTHPNAYDKIKVIWTSTLLPSDAMVWRKDLDEDIKRRLMMFFMSFGRLGTVEEVRRARQLLASMTWGPFRPSGNSHLYLVRRLEITKDILRVTGDDKIPEPEKKARLEALQSQLDALNTLAEEIPHR